VCVYAQLYQQSGEIAHAALIAQGAPPRGRTARAAWRPCAPLHAKPFILSHAIALDEATTPCAKVWFAAAFGGTTRSQVCRSTQRRIFMTSKKQIVRKPSKKVIDSRRVRFGGGSTPRVLRTEDTATRDSRTIRFGGGSCPAALRK
jgi:hypothetical protein